jgi:hypothetical protein
VIARRCVAILILLALLAGCAPRLFPGPGAQEVDGPGAGATTVAKGIRLTARAEAWEGSPRDLAEHVTPMLVTIANDGPVPVRIRYRNFQLVSDRFVSHLALPLDWIGVTPREDMVRNALAEGVLHPGDRASGFLYFERADPKADRLRLLADFEDAESGWRVVRLGIPFLAGLVN